MRQRLPLTFRRTTNVRQFDAAGGARGKNSVASTKMTANFRGATTAPPPPVYAALQHGREFNDHDMKASLDAAAHYFFSPTVSNRKMTCSRLHRGATPLPSLCTAII
jgi:hypothetical protein